jgi:hypothetical protein
MWDTTALHRLFCLVQWPKNIEVRGIPHLAKNERDVGHPSICGQGRVLPQAVSFLLAKLRGKKIVR